MLFHGSYQHQRLPLHPKGPTMCTLSCKLQSLRSADMSFTMSAYKKNDIFEHWRDQLWGDGTVHSIFTDINTDKWKLVRKAVLPAFSSNSIKYGPDLVLLF